MPSVERHVRFRSRRVKRKEGKVSIMLAGFYSLPSAKDPDVMSECNRDELLLFAKEVGPKNSFAAKTNKITVYSDDLYERLLIYAVVRQSLRDSVKVFDLREIIKSLGLYEVHFWASMFAELYRTALSRVALYRPAKAFKVLYKLGKG